MDPVTGMPIAAAVTADAGGVITAVGAYTGPIGVIVLLGVVFFVGLMFLLIRFISKVTESHIEGTKHITERFASSVDRQSDVMKENTKALADLRVAVATNHPLR